MIHCFEWLWTLAGSYNTLLAGNIDLRVGGFFAGSEVVAHEGNKPLVAAPAVRRVELLESFGVGFQLGESCLQWLDQLRRFGDSDFIRSPQRLIDSSFPSHRVEVVGDVTRVVFLTFFALVLVIAARASAFHLLGRALEINV